MNPDHLAAHLQVARYGDFLLTEAIRPSPRLEVVPRQGYRLETYRDLDAGLRVPVLAAAVSAERLFDTFVELLAPLGGVVDVVLESSHRSAGHEHRDLVREQIDLPVLLSHLYDFEELLLDDGCTGIAVIAPDRAMEVQLDEHKLLIVYAHDLRPFERVLRRAGLARDVGLRLITEAEHLHSTHPGHEDQFEQLANRLGVGEAAFA